MASIAGTALTVSVRPPRQLLQVSNHLSGLKSVSFTSQRKSFVSIRSVSFTSQRKSFGSIRSAPRFRVSCAAKPETVEKVCFIVRKQLALAENVPVTGESTFVQLGADSLDTVEVVMGLEEEFGISVEEENAQSIQTVQDAADMIELLLEKKHAV